MKIKTRYLVYPILLAIVLVISLVFVLTKFSVESTAQGYHYKDKLFQVDALNTIALTIEEEDWQAILDNPTDEEYVEATVSVNGEQYEHVGVRAKGNSSLSSVASSDSDRYSLKLDFSQYYAAQTYYGLEKINLNNSFSDSTLIKEYVSYSLMKQFGITTPAFTFTKVMLNGSYYGLMLAVEEPGEAFVKTNYSTSDGFLFKPENTGSDLKYMSDTIEDYSGILNGVKYSGGVVEQDSNLITMIKQINNNDYRSLDINAVAKYFALNTALVNMDSYQGNFNHNYYLYENKDGQFTILPWDYNMSFGGFGGGGGFGGRGYNSNNEAQDEQGNQAGNQANNGQRPNGDTQANPGNRGNAGGQAGGGNRLNNMGNSNLLDESNINLSIYSPVSGSSIANKPLLNVILQNEETLKLYEQYLEEITTTLLTEDNIKAIVEPLEALLYEAVDEDTTKFSTSEQFIEGIRGEQSLVNFAVARSIAIQEQLNDESAKEVLNSSTSGESAGTSSPIGNTDGQVVVPNGGGGQVSPNFEGGEMPNFENMPNGGGGQVPPNFEGGEMPNFENMPNGGGGQVPPNFEGGEMPNFGGGQGGPGFPGQQTNEVSYDYSAKQLLITLAVCIIAVLLSIMLIRYLSGRKYTKGEM